MKLSAELIKSEKEFVARCPELDINCYGSDKNEAIRRLKSVIQFYIDSAKELGLEIDAMIALSIDGEITGQKSNDNPAQYSNLVN
ncbi:MAG: hypothetical protein JW864_12460 [Spirochaetes bacterium]|nr:hypothetical protein [Spirochaetota bacterium]